MRRKLRLMRPGRIMLGLITAFAMSIGLVAATQTGVAAHGYGHGHGHGHEHTVPACTNSHGRAYEKNPHCEGGDDHGGGDHEGNDDAHGNED